MPLRRVAAVVPLLVAVVLVAVLLTAGRGPQLVLEGLPKGALDAAEVAATTVSVRTPGPARLLLDRREVARTRAGLLTARLAGLRDGRHVLVVETDRGLLQGARRSTRAFQVDTVAPGLAVRGRAGLATDVDHLATTDGRDVDVAPDGSFTVPPGTTGLVALDDAGNRTETDAAGRTVAPGAPTGR